MKRGNPRKVLIMKIAAALSLLAVSFVAGSCAQLRQGWVKVDFIEGEPSPIMLCKMELKKDDLTARCASIEAIEAEMRRQSHTNDGSM